MVAHKDIQEEGDRQRHLGGYTLGVGQPRLKYTVLRRIWHTTVVGGNTYWKRCDEQPQPER